MPPTARPSDSRFFHSVATPDYVFSLVSYGGDTDYLAVYQRKLYTNESLLLSLTMDTSNRYPYATFTVIPDQLNSSRFYYAYSDMYGLRYEELLVQPWVLECELLDEAPT